MPSDSQNQQDCPTTIHPEGASQLVLVDLILGNRLILTESNPAAGSWQVGPCKQTFPCKAPLQAEITVGLKRMKEDGK